MRATAAMPGYGLAEATLVVSFGAPHHPAMVDKVSQAGPRRSSPRAASSGDSEEVRHVVCFGNP